MNIKNRHKTVEFWRQYLVTLCKNYQSDSLEILDGTRYMPCNCKISFVLFISLKLWKYCKTAKFAFYMIKNEKS